MIEWSNISAQVSTLEFCSIKIVFEMAEIVAKTIKTEPNHGNQTNNQLEKPNKPNPTSPFKTLISLNLLKPCALRLEIDFSYLSLMWNA